MGLFGPSPEKIRRTAEQAFPEADWKIDIDWSTGSKLHQLRGSLREGRTDSEMMKMAHEVWTTITKVYRLNPDDGRHGLLNVCVASTGGPDQSTGTQG